MNEVSIVQPYVPQYRVPFFLALRDELNQASIALRVIAGRVTGEQALRGDAAREPWIDEVPQRAMALGRRTLVLTSSHHLWRTSDAVIVPHQGSSLDALGAFIRRRPARVGVWGHIGSYTSPLHPIDGAIERQQLRRANHVFAYTPDGAKVAVQQGARPGQVTTVMNTIDTSGLEVEIAQVTPKSIAQFTLEHHIPDKPYLAYIGGLDRSKRVDLLSAALDILYDRGSTLHVVVAGRGKDENLLARARARGQCTLIGYADQRSKAHLLSGARAIVNPGRVGLIAVDALVARKPIITTHSQWHAPEIEYVRQPGILHTCADDATSFASLLRAAEDERLLAAPGDWPDPPRLQDMVSNFARGVRSLLA